MNDINSSRAAIQGSAAKLGSFCGGLIPLFSDVLIMFWRAYVLAVLWGWFMGFTKVEIGFMEAFGAVLVVRILTVPRFADIYTVVRNGVAREGDQLGPLDLLYVQALDAGTLLLLLSIGYTCRVFLL